MADPKPQQQEPSMEEILASIRRIISEDDAEAPPAAAEEPAEPAPAPAEPSPEPKAAAPAKPAPEPPAEPSPEPKAAAPAKPAPEPSPESKAAAPAKPAPPPEPEPEEAEDEDVLDLTEKVSDDATVVPLAKPPAEPPAKPAPAEVEIRDVAEEPPPAEVAPEPAPAPQPVPSRAVPESNLVSQPTAQAATASLAALAQAVDREVSGGSLGVGGRTLEDLVKEIMRPMIREWLDAHLPTLVERLVRREIERISYYAQTGDDR